MKRHAYCIIAHNDEYVLTKLIECIDDPRNDIFIHFDKKSNLHSLNITTNHSKVHIIDKSRSINVSWGGYSQVETEMLILKEAVNEENHAYYHLLSGTDLPIKSQNEIHAFFDSLPEGTNLIGFKDYESSDKRNMMKRVVPFHFFKTKYRHPNKLVRFFYRGFEEVASQIQRMMGLKTNHNIEYRKGCNWVSLSSEFVQYLIKQEDFIRKTFQNTILCDEVFIQTIIWNSPFKSTILNPYDEYAGCMREIDWERGKPYTWKMENFEELMNSEKLFARKFSSAEDQEIINKIAYILTH